MAEQTLVERMNGRKAAMKLERSSFEPHWQEIGAYISTRTSRYLRTDRNRGEKVSQKIINETATLAHRTLESGMMAGMSSPARPWFALAPPDPEMKKFGPVKDWLDTVTKIMLEAFARSNLYSVLPKQYGGVSGYGTAAFGLLEDEKEIFRAYPFPVGSFYIDCNDRMTVDTCYREFSMTVRQLVEKFGKRDEKTGLYKMDNFSSVVRNAWDQGNYGTWIAVTHAVEPNHGRDRESLQSKDKPFISVYYEDAGDKGQVLRTMGFDEFPVMASRWHVNGEDVYGTRCPGMDALGSVKALQLEERRKYQAIDKLVNPAMNADSTLRNTGADLLPGGFNWIPGMAMNGNPGIRPIYEINPHIQELMLDIEKVEGRIRRCFYEDLMLMLATSDNSQMTAREVEERHSEKLLVLGPMMEQQNDDLFDPLIDRSFNQMLRRGKFPPPPDELQGQSLRVEYISIMAQAQKLIGVSSLERFVGFVGQMAAFNPEVLDKVNSDAAVEEYGAMTGITGNIIVPDDQVKAVREARAKAAQQQKMAESLPAIQSGAQAAKTLSETDMSGDNALARMMSQLTGG